MNYTDIRYIPLEFKPVCALSGGEVFKIAESYFIFRDGSIGWAPILLFSSDKDLIINNVNRVKKPLTAKIAKLLCEPCG
jgi:hypothetical protein